MRFASLSLTCLLVACVPVDPAPEDLTSDDSFLDDKADRVGAAAVDTYFIVERDLRECVAPACGGYFIKRLSREKTTCADGTSADRCYVADLDLSRVGLEASRLAPEEIIVRGNLARVSAGRFASLTVTEAYRSTGGAAPTTTIYELSDNGMRCIAAPCFSLTAAKLNSTVTVTLSGLAGELAGVAQEELAFAPVLVTGSWRTVERAGPAGDGRVLTPTRVWTRLQADSPAACKVDADCEVTAYTRFVASPSECYCPTCEDGVVSRATAEDNRASWERHCAAVRLACSKVACVAAPGARCVADRCAVAE